MVAVLLAVVLGGSEVPRWPRFRGVDGTAVAADGAALPVRFDAKTNVRWRTPLPSGYSSPCIWGDRIFLTGYEEETKRLETICLERRTGKILWRRAAPAERIERVYKVNNPASATPACDGKRVVVSFGSFGLLCYDLDGKELWQRALPTPRTTFGSATSPILVGERVLLNGQGKSLGLLVVEAGTGKTVYEIEDTPFPSDYPVPVLWESGGVTEVIVPGRRGLLAYDFRDGSKRWWIPGLAKEVAASPCLGSGLLFVSSHMPGGDPEARFELPAFPKLLEKHDKNKDGKLQRAEVPTDLRIFSRGGKEGVGDLRLSMMFWLFDRNSDGWIDAAEYRSVQDTPFTNSLLAIRPGGKEDVSGTHVAWRATKGVPEVPSPLFYQDRIYMVRNGGLLTCLHARTGQELYPRSRLGTGGLYYASPVAGDGKVYLCSDGGLVTVLRAGDRFEVLAENDLGETIRATPALVEGTIYLRTASGLYAFGE